MNDEPARRAEALRAWFLAGRSNDKPATGETIEAWERRYMGLDLGHREDDAHYGVPAETMRSLEKALLSFGVMRNVASVIRPGTWRHRLVTASAALGRCLGRISRFFRRRA